MFRGRKVKAPFFADEGNEFQAPFGVEDLVQSSVDRVFQGLCAEDRGCLTRDILIHFYRCLGHDNSVSPRLVQRPRTLRRMTLDLPRGLPRRYTLGPAALITAGNTPLNDPEQAPQLPQGSVPFQDTFPVNIEPISIPRPRP